MTSALSTSDHTITLSDGATSTYHLRSLEISTSEEGQEHHADITKWTTFCASVFSYKANPPSASYFARHFYNDPRRDPGLVRVLIHCPNNTEEERKHGEIVSSVRIFRRTLSCGDAGVSTIEAGGIGEVCTSPNHQRRGLSKILLKDAIRIMSSSSKEEGGMTSSLLHAAPDFRPVYSKAGDYRSVRSEWSAVPIKLQHLSTSKIGDERLHNDWCIRPAKFPQDAEQMQKLHAGYSEKRLITVVRTVQYWKEYVGPELGDSLWVLSKPNGDGQDIIVAWISIRKRGDRYQLREFGVDKSNDDNNVKTYWAMERLLGVALDHAGENLGTEKEAPLLMPTFVYKEMQEDMGSEAFTGTATEENDDGWMYVNFGDSRSDVLDLTTRKNDPISHVIWPTDSF